MDGRAGGAANTVRLTQEEVAKAREENARVEKAAREKEMKKEAPMDKVQGLAEKGKGMLTKGGKEKS